MGLCYIAVALVERFSIQVAPGYNPITMRRDLQTQITAQPVLNHVLCKMGLQRERAMVGGVAACGQVPVEYGVLAFGTCPIGTAIPDVPAPLPLLSASPE
ncbi:cytochrome P450 [Apiospora marii]|uniref:Cytochrome P450 n=1 Tax=Apiospora marii TaxID=335849 RepID=A0ABR1SHG0_9PEZI